MVKTVVVLSLPRSGSSMLSGLLLRLGINMGKGRGLNLHRNMNKFGCYENRMIFRLFFRILFKSGWVGWGSYPDEKKLKENINRFKKRIKKVIKLNQRDLWGFKVPETIFFINHIHPYFNNPYYIFLKRDKNKIVNSQLNKLKNPYSSFKSLISYFRKRVLIKLGFRWLFNFFRDSSFMNEKSLKKYVDKNYEICNKFLKNKKHLTINFEDFLKKPRKSIDKLVKFLDITPNASQLRRALNFVRPKEVHF